VNKNSFNNKKILMNFYFYKKHILEVRWKFIIKNNSNWWKIYYKFIPQSIWRFLNLMSQNELFMTAITCIYQKFIANCMNVSILKFIILILSSESCNLSTFLSHLFLILQHTLKYLICATPKHQLMQSVKCWHMFIAINRE
jgi:hypothetical protein